MTTAILAPRQPSLLDLGSPTRRNRAHERIHLGEASWVDWCPGWLGGADELFEWCFRSLPWSGGERRMYDRIVVEPRLSASLDPSMAPSVVAAAGEELSQRYDRDLTHVFANLYRDGSDSVAWHGDRIGRRRRTTVIPVLSLGGPRSFALRPRGGGPSRRFEMRSGDLLVMGGECQRDHEHAVPKRRHAEPRISLTFREQSDGDDRRLAPRR